MKVLFAIAKLDFADHIAIAYLSAIARQNGCQTYLSILDTNNFQEDVGRIRPDVIAYSANVIGFEAIVEAHLLASARHHFTSILGGPQATFSPETFEKSGMDAYCIGEGEYAFSDFLTRLKWSEPFDDIPNLITKTGRNPVRDLVRDLDDLPFPDRDLTLSSTFLKTTPKKTFYATRGCPFKCSYCCNNLYHELYRGKGNFVRRFSVDRILSEIEYVKSRYRTGFIKFGDDCFVLKADTWMEEFSEQYPKRIGIPFNCFLRIDTITERLLHLLKKAGCHSVHLSIDSASKHVRENVLKRRMRTNDFLPILKMINSYGINTWVNYMLAAPESSLEDDIETIKMSKEGKVTYPAYSTTVPMYGTELYNYCVERKLIDPVNHKSDMTGCTEKSNISSFTDRERDIRFNIYLLGAIISKLPFPLDRFAIELIQIIRPNKLFRRMRQIMYKHYIENKIFKLPA